MGRFDVAWDRLFERHELEARLRGEGLAFLTADEIRWAGEEPRLMTKFDFPDTRPQALRRLGATILAVSNGRYALVHGDGYGPLRRDGVPLTVLESGALSELMTLEFPPASESQAIDAAWACGVLEHFVGEPVRQTIRGRLRAPAFSYRFDACKGSVQLDVDGVQVEVDGGFEGATAVYLIEAKMGASDAFMIRQLYYPFRFWGERLRGRKPVVPIFMDCANGEFLLVQYVFEPVDRYHGLRAVRSARYTFASKQHRPTLAQIWAEARPDPDLPAFPFPQADRLERVVDVVDAVARGTADPAELALRWGFDPRQADYYANAAAYIGLLYRAGGVWSLTPDGARLARTPVADERRVFVARCLLRRPALHAAVRRTLDTAGVVEPRDFEPIIRAHTRLSGTTPARRAVTVAAWMRTVQQWLPETG